MKKLNDSELLNVSGGVIIKLIPAEGCCKQFKANYEKHISRIGYYNAEEMLNLKLFDIFSSVHYVVHPDGDGPKNPLRDFNAIFETLEEAEIYASVKRWTTNLEDYTMFWDSDD